MVKELEVSLRKEAKGKGETEETCGNQVTWWRL
jgi:hypothetical protein